MSAECPNRSTLFDYLVGKLPDDASDSLANHVDACPDCQAELATLSDIEDTLIGQLRGAAAPEPFLDESECGRAIAKAKGVAAENGDAVGKGDSPHLCEAPEGPFRQMGTVPFSPPETSQTSLPAQLGEYRLIERLGSGGMGAVYKAVHNRLDRVVALKILPRAQTADRRAIVRFEREMKAIGRLDHPHIVRAYDAREIDDRLVLVMEFVEGLDLGKIVRRLGVGKGDRSNLCEAPGTDRRLVGPFRQIGPVPFSDACELARQAALGLQAAHEHGMVHRDVKPSNLMLTPEGQVKLLDLGLARLVGKRDRLLECGDLSPLSGEGFDLSQNAAMKESGDKSPHSKADDEMTGTGQAMGTADYMAPEQTSDSRTVDIRADIYGLGATLYKLLSGRAPFSGPEYQGAFDKMLAHRQTPPPPIRQFCPDIPDGLVAVLDRMLAKDPAARYQTPAEAAEALAPFCAGSDLPALLQAAEAGSAGVSPASSSAGILPAPGGRDARAPGPRRWRTIAAVVVALLLVGGGGFGLGVMIHIRNQNGEEATINVPNKSNVDIDNQGKATVTVPGGMTKERAPQFADLQFEIAKVAAELAGQRALLKNVDEVGLSPVEVDQLAQSDPVVRQLSTELGWKKMDRAYAEGSTKKGQEHPYAKRYREEIDRLQKQYDERIKEIETKIRQERRSVIETEIIRLQATLAALRQPQGGPPEPAAPATSDAKAIQGTWEIVSSTFSLIDRLPGGENVSDERVRKSTKIVITADTFRVMGKYVFNRAFDYQLNLETKPKIIDFQFQNDTNVYLGIFQVSGNELKICATSRTGDASQRPTEFWAEYGAGKELLVLRRTGDVVVSDDEKAILGTWRVESQPLQGFSYSLFSHDQQVVFSPRTMKLRGWGTSDGMGSMGGIGGTGSAGGAVGGGAADPSAYIAEAQYALDPYCRPRAIDIAASSVSAGPINAIYELQNDRLTLCYQIGQSIEGSPRPTKFAADEKTNTAIVVLKRVAEPAGKGHGQASSAEKPKEAALQFGPVIERVVNARGEGKGKDAIDLANGKLVDLPKDFCQQTADKQRQWCEQNNADLLFDAGTKDKNPSLVPEALMLALVDDEQWTVVSENFLRSALTSDTPEILHSDDSAPSISSVVVKERGGIVFWTLQQHPPLTFAFQTRKGTLGLLQVIRYTEEPHGVRIRYKLAQPPAAIGAIPVATPSVPEVPVCRPVLRDVTDYKDFTGHTEACQTVDVRSRVAGELVKVAFAGGAAVKQGDLLFEIDPRQYQAEFDKRAADLSAANTRAQYAAAELERAKSLAKSRAISTNDMDRAESERKEAQAAVLAAEADLKLAKLNLDSTKIRAAISGFVSRPQAGVGNQLMAGWPLATIVSSDPMRVVFEIDERSLLDLRRRAIEEKAKTGLELPIEVRFGTADERDYPHHCTIESKGERLDPARGVAVWRATVPNPDGLLMPGMFARVQLSVGSPHKALLIPEESLGSDQGRRFVFVVIDKKNTAERRYVEIGQLVGNFRVIRAGLTVDDWVIDSSQPFLAPGATVKPRPETPSSPAPPGGTATNGGEKQKRPPAFRMATVTRGDIAVTVSATGTIEPEEVVDIGTAVAGQIVRLGDDPRSGGDPQFKGKSVDYGSPVYQGTILVQIDPTIYEARVKQEEAGLRRAQAELTLVEAKAKEQTPEVAKAAREAAKATVLQSESALALAKTNLDYTIIRSPVKGVIIDRRVNIGQNVAPAGQNVSSLFLIAKDFKRMQVWAAVNEADVTRIRKGMKARFTVDAFPKETFKGAVLQIRMNAAVTQNVVVYTVVVGFDNSDLKLVPYLTANVQFQVEKRSNVLRVPNAALRWKPVPDLVASNAATPEAQGAMRSLPPGTALWIKTPDGQHVQRIPINVGLNDGLLSEVSGPDVKEGMKIVIGQQADGNNPFPPRLFQR